MGTRARPHETRVSSLHSSCPMTRASPIPRAPCPNALPISTSPGLHNPPINRHAPTAPYHSLSCGPPPPGPLDKPPPPPPPERATVRPPCDIPSSCCSFTGPWTVTRSSLSMLRRVAAFCRPVLLLVSFPCSRCPVVGVLGLCWMWRDVPFAHQRRPVVAPPPAPPNDSPRPLCTTTALGLGDIVSSAPRTSGASDRRPPPPPFETS